MLDFKGDMLASAVNRLAREIDAVLSVARPENDEVVLRLESPGGTVTGYGLAAARLQRLRAARVKLTICVDQVAASGGYMMAAAADRLIAAPFAMIGSIGVVAQIPNFNRVLKKNDIDVEVMTAGEYKRSVSLFGEITPAGREHFQGKLEETHEAFKRMIAELRPGVAIGEVGNGDVWLARDALALGLIDELCVERRLSVPPARPGGDLSHQEPRGKSRCCGNCWTGSGSGAAGFLSEASRRRASRSASALVDGLAADDIAVVVVDRHIGRARAGGRAGGKRRAGEAENERRAAPSRRPNRRRDRPNGRRRASRRHGTRRHGNRLLRRHASAGPA